MVVHGSMSKTIQDSCANEAFKDVGVVTGQGTWLSKTNACFFIQNYLFCNFKHFKSISNLDLSQIHACFSAFNSFQSQTSKYLTHLSEQSMHKRKIKTKNYPHIRSKEHKFIYLNLPINICQFIVGWQLKGL